MSTRRATLKALIRPAASKKGPDGETVYRYMVMGLIATDRPLDAVPNDRVLEDSSIHLSGALEMLRLRVPKETMLGDAKNVMTRLGEL